MNRKSVSPVPTGKGTDMNSVDETTRASNTKGWRVVDIVVAAVLGVAVGLIFYAWNVIGYPWYKAADALTPGLGGLFAGVWYLGGPIGGLIIRKPGAAIFVEMIAAITSTLLGNVWAAETLLSGFAQGLGAELVFLAVRYQKANLPIALLAGAGAGLGAWVLELFTRANFAKGTEYLLIYLGTNLISGAIMAGLFAWVLAKALAATGVLSRFSVTPDTRV